LFRESFDRPFCWSLMCCPILGTAISFFYLSWNMQLALLIPGGIALGYVLPFLGNQKRLRDINHVKIFLVAIVWAWVSVLLPALQEQISLDGLLALMIAERALFIFAITLPFDIRDLQVDQHSQVSTLPAQLGVTRSKLLANLLLLLCGLLATVLYLLDYYSFSVLVGLLLAYLSTALLLYFSHPKKHDYFYSGLMDGTMILQFVLVWICSNLL
ncbi:MAG: UbiA family prenyltransferase, partial [Bacteroidota bacterium]